MINEYSNELEGVVNSAEFVKGDSRVLNAKMRRTRATVGFNGQAIGIVTALAALPAGAVFSHGIITASASAGAATVAIGTVNAPAKYRPAAVVTAVDTPAVFGKAAGIAEPPLTGSDFVVLTVGGAALPNNAEYLIIDIFYSDLS